VVYALLVLVKRLEFMKVPRAVLLFTPKSFKSPAKGLVGEVSTPSPDVESADEVLPPSNDVSHEAVDALLVAEVLLAADVPVAWATAAACPASPVALVVCCGAANGVNCEAAAEDPA
jgi:hypothetical protein